MGAVRSQAPSPGASPGGEAGWLSQGSVEERFAVVASQLRGFDVAMVEVGYRYGELYWAGRDGNWEFAAYQIEKGASLFGRRDKCQFSVAHSRAP